MTTISSKNPVMVTGATGYVAGWIIKKLLDAGVTIHAAVRDPSNQDKIKHLKELENNSSGEIHFFKADLLQEGSYSEAMKGYETVFHSASPFTTDVKDPQKELVDPALLGTKNVLNEASKTSSVKRIVLTSSVAAIYGDNADVEKSPKGILTEEVWNTSSSLQHQAYSYSKTVAEKAAWEIANQQDQWSLVVINPSLVLGPGTKYHATSESFKILRQICDGTMKVGTPSWGMGIVDVREVADAHIAAAFRPRAQGRHITSGHNADLRDIAASLLEKYGSKYPLPRRKLPKWLIWMLGPFINKAMTRKTVSLNVDIPWKADNSKSIQELGIKYRPLQQTIEDMFQQMIDAGCFLKKPKKGSS